MTEQTINVLLVEDAVVTARLVAGILKKSSDPVYQVTITTTLADTLAILAERPIDVVILDLGLPDSNGLETFTKVRQSGTNAAIIVVSGNDDRDTATFAIRHGAQDYILKEFLSANVIYRVIKYSLERKSILEAAYRAKEASATIMEKSPFGIIVIGRDEVVRSVNQAAMEMIGGGDRSKVEGRTIKEFLENSTPTKLHGSEQMLRIHDGSTIPVLSTFIDINLDGEEVKLINLIDLTERKQVEADRSRAQKLESVGQLAAGIAHETNTPIQFVSDNLRFMQDSLSDLMDLVNRFEDLVGTLEKGPVEADKVAEYREAMEEADLEYLKEELPMAINQSLEGAGRVAKIVRAMKEFSHPGSSEIKKADISEAIKTTITVARNEWKYSARVVTDLDENMPLVPCLVGEMNQVILNMIVNAKDSIEEKVQQGGEFTAVPDPAEESAPSGDDTPDDIKGKISISTSHDDRWATIKVSDNGNGIPEEIIKRVFDPFFTTKEVGKGTGQGLAIAHCVVVDKHQGELDVDSAPGEGTTFTIRLPLEVETESRDEETAEPAYEGSA